MDVFREKGLFFLEAFFPLPFFFLFFIWCYRMEDYIQHSFLQL